MYSPSPNLKKQADIEIAETFETFETLFVESHAI